MGKSVLGVDVDGNGLHLEAQGSMMRRVFILTVLGILLVAAGVKLKSAARSERGLKMDPVFVVLSENNMAVIASVVELGVCFALAHPRVRKEVKIACICWLGGLFLAYHLALNVITNGGTCNCFGGMFAGTSGEHYGVLISVYLFAPSGIYLLFHSTSLRKGMGVDNNGRAS